MLGFYIRKTTIQRTQYFLFWVNLIQEITFLWRSVILFLQLLIFLFRSTVNCVTCNNERWNESAFSVQEMKQATWWVAKSPQYDWLDTRIMWKEHGSNTRNNKGLDSIETYRDYFLLPWAPVFVNKLDDCFMSLLGRKLGNN